MSPGITGQMPFKLALDRLLAGTGLIYRETTAGIIIVETVAVQKAQEPSPPEPDRAVISSPVIVTGSLQGDPVRFLGDIQIAPRTPSIEALVQTIPGMSTQPSGPGQQSVVVRGVGMAGETTTIVYFGGVPISGPSGPGNDGARTTSDLALVDIRYARSSRSSHSTEHGIGSLAGEIEIEPQIARLDRWEGNTTLAASMQTGGEPGYFLSSTLNAPLGSSAAARLTAYRRSVGGYIDNVRTGQSNVNDDDLHGARLMLRYNPIQSLDTNLMLLWQHRRLNDASAWFRSLGAYKTDRYFNAHTTHDFKLARLSVQYAPGPVRLETITGYYKWRLDRNYDRTNVTLLQSKDSDGCQRYIGLTDRSCSSLELINYSNFVTAYTPTLLHIPIVSQRWIQEVRLGQEQAQGFNWTVGALIDRRNESARSELSAYYSQGSEDYFGARELDMHRTQASAFGNMSWIDDSGFSASAGMRFDHFVVSSRNNVVVPNIISGSILSWPTTSITTNGWHARLHSDVPLSSRLSLHAQMNRSFRPAGVNIASVLLPDRYSYGGDRLWGLEVGFKMRLPPVADLTVTAYVNDWQDMQYRALSENRSHAYLVNIGNASIKGIEAELALEPAIGWKARVEASLIKTNLTRTTPASELVGNAKVGDHVPFVPNKRARASVAREWQMPDGKRLKLMADWQYQSGFSSTFNADDPDYLATPGFQLFGASAQFETGSSSFSFGMRNIFDQVANLRSLTTGYGVGQSFSVGPRELSLSWSRRW